MMELSALLGIAITLALGVASPGPSFVLVARLAASEGRASGLGAALGMGVGGVVFALLSLAGLQGLLNAVPALYFALKLAGGAYLVYLGWCIWRSAGSPLNDAADGPANSPRGARHGLLLGLVTQLSNPKTALVYASVFAAFLPPVLSMQFAVAVLALVFLIEAGWYAVVAWVLSASAARQRYLRWKVWIDRAAGGIMTALGVKLATTAGH
ncbi:MAG: LysE family translocator [Burkholderiales bacterium]|nr:LysE family translocator [Burkholderiales bacterium]